MNDAINRLGFDAWADNKMMNAIEDHVYQGVGYVQREADDYNLHIKWDDKHITCVIRAHTDAGWQTYEKQIKRCHRSVDQNA